MSPRAATASASERPRPLDTPVMNQMRCAMRGASSLRGVSQMRRHGEGQFWLGSPARFGVRAWVRALKIFFVSPEGEPFVKVGGLADMGGALPKELAKLGHDVRIVCPAYGSIKRPGEGGALDQP